MSSTEASSLDLMQARLEALYVFDGRGRITGINSPFDLPVPRFHLCRTAQGNLWCHRADTPDVGVSDPSIAVLENGHAVCVCTSVRIGALAYEAGLETDPNARRKGYAVIAAAAWAHTVRARGRLPLYSTSWENAASQGVAASLGAALYGTDFHIT